MATKVVTEPFECLDELDVLETKAQNLNELIRIDAPYSQVRDASKDIDDYVKVVKKVANDRQRETGIARYCSHSEKVWIKTSDVEEIDGAKFLEQYGLDENRQLKPGLNLAIGFTKKGLKESGFLKDNEVDWTRCTKIASRRVTLQGVDAVVKECSETIEHVVQCHGFELPEHDKEDATSLVTALFQFNQNTLWRD